MPRADPKSNLFNHQYTSLVTLAEACKEDLVVVDSRTASRLGSLPRLLLVRSVNAVVRLVDPQTGRIAELHTEGYFKAPPSVRFGVLCSSHRCARRRPIAACSTARRDYTPPARHRRDSRQIRESESHATPKMTPYTRRSPSPRRSSSLLWCWTSSGWKAPRLQHNRRRRRRLPKKGGGRSPLLVQGS